MFMFSSSLTTPRSCNPATAGHALVASRRYRLRPCNPATALGLCRRHALTLALRALRVDTARVDAFLEHRLRHALVQRLILS